MLVRMKSLITLTILISLITSNIGCFPSDNLHLVNASEINIAIGTSVLINLKAYEKCHGYISGFTRYRINNNPINYVVSLYCPNIGWLKEDITVPGNYLKVTND